jgi:hypothetical protein
VTVAITAWDVAQWPVVVAAVITALGVCWTKVVVPMRAFARRFKAWMDKVETTVDWVDHQMRRNGGMTLLDKVHGTSEKVDELSEKVDQLLTHDSERDVVGRRYGKPTDPQP